MASEIAESSGSCWRDGEGGVYLYQGGLEVEEEKEKVLRGREREKCVLESLRVAMAVFRCRLRY